MTGRMKKTMIGLTLSILIIGGVPVAASAAETAPAPSSVCNGMGKAAGMDKVRAITIVSELLKMTPEEIRAERLKGKSLAMIASEKGISKEQLVNAILVEKKEKLDVLVADGKITKEQAELCQQQMKARIEANVDRTEAGNPFKGKGRVGKGKCGMGKGRHFGNGGMNVQSGT